MSDEEKTPEEKALELTPKDLKYVEDMPGGGARLRLEKPVEFNKEKITELEIREPNTGEMMELSQPPTPKEFALLLSKISQKPPAVIKILAYRDYGRAVSVMGKLLADGQVIGSSSSEE